ncbi:MAG: cyclic nucleotide-binding domain-containing protein [Spirochaetales bacterium]|nr:cyclic nucleotide-binding domain-containing protein [Spirochaetales bacterium]MBP7264717.1 cyclic nucleotide-binding domain-containing protein [Spirochaetia bacterium]
MRQLPVNHDPMLQELAATLILQNLSLEELRRIIGVCEHWEYAPGEAIVTQDSVSRYLYILLSGSVDIMVRGAEKEQVRVSGVEKGDVFGETSMFMDVRRTASVVARTQVRLVSISRDHIFEYCNAMPTAGLKILTFIIYSLLRKLNTMNRDLALERESMVTQEDLDTLKDLFPKTLDQIIQASEP